MMMKKVENAENARKRLLKDAEKYFSSFTKTPWDTVMSVNQPFDPDGNCIKGYEDWYSIGYSSWNQVYYVDTDWDENGRYFGFKTLMEAKAFIYRAILGI